MLRRENPRAAGLRDGWWWPVLARPGSSPSAPSRWLPGSAPGARLAGMGVPGARAAGAPGNPPGPGLHGWPGSAAPFSAQCPEPRSQSTGLPLLPLLSSFISQRWQAWKGFWWEMCFELAYFPLHTMEALSCCVLQVQTKAAQAVFSIAVWSFIPPLSPELQAYLTNFHSFCKEGSTTDKILLFDRFQTLEEKENLSILQRATRCLCTASTELQLRVHPPESLCGCRQHLHGPCHRGFPNSNTFTVTQ